MKIFNKTAFALILVVFAFGGAHLQNRKTKQYVYNDITLANLNAIMDSENNGSNPETGGSNPETGSGYYSEMGFWEYAWDKLTHWDRKDWDCIPLTCVTPYGPMDATKPEETAPGKGSEVHSWHCLTCADLVPPKTLPV